MGRESSIVNARPDDARPHESSGWRSDGVSRELLNPQSHLLYILFLLIQVLTAGYTGKANSFCLIHN
jgi:hypothetical protein